MDAFGIVPQPCGVAFDLYFEILSFIKGIPVQVVYMCQAFIRQTGTYLGSKFCFLVLLASDDGTNMWLMNAEDTVVATPKLYPENHTLVDS